MDAIHILNGTHITVT